MIKTFKEKFSKYYNDKALIFELVSRDVDVSSISVISIITKVVSTKYFDSNYSGLYDFSYENSSDIFNAIFTQGFNASIFEIGPLLSFEVLSKIKNFSPFCNLQKNHLASINNIQRSYQLLTGIRNAGLFEINYNDFKNACYYLNKTSNSLIILSKRESLFSYESLDQLFLKGAYNINNVIVQFNKVSIICDICIKGDLVVISDGEFDDLYRSINIFYCSDLYEGLFNNLGITENNGRAGQGENPLSENESAEQDGVCNPVQPL